MHLSPGFFKSHGQVVRYGGDLLILPNYDDFDWIKLETIIRRLSPRTLAGIEGLSLKMILENSPAFLAMKLMDTYGRSRQRAMMSGRGDVEPLWVYDLPPHFRGMLRADWWRQSESIEPLIINNLPDSGLSYIILEDGLTDDVITAFKLRRLSGIRQLGFLHNSIGELRDWDGSDHVITEYYRHTRFDHVLNVGTVMALMLANNSLSEREAVHGRVAALSHDARMPAGGDTIKFIDPAAFDEDAHYHELLHGRGWQVLRDKYDLSAELLIETIANRGLLGQLLDLADKIAYVGRDAWAFKFHDGAPVTPQRQRVVRQIQAAEQACEVWQHVVVDDDQMIVTDAQALYDFLKLRALLFAEVYYHPGSRFHELLFAYGVAEYLYHTGRITVSQLCAWQDSDLDIKIRELTGFTGWWFDPVIGRKGLDYQVFTDRRRALRFRNEKFKSGATMVHLEDASRRPKVGSHFLTLDRHGQVKTLAEAYPDWSAELQKIVSWPDLYRVYWCADGPYDQKFMSGLRGWRARHWRLKSTS